MIGSRYSRLVSCLPSKFPWRRALTTSSSISSDSKLHLSPRQDNLTGSLSRRTSSTGQSLHKSHYQKSGSNGSPRPKWIWISIPGGLAVIGFVGYKHVYERGNSQHDRRKLSVSLYQTLPLRGLSRLWGKFNNVNLPEWSRRPLLMVYVKAFGCNLEEAAVEDLRHYKNLGEFFRRALKPSSRPTDSSHEMVMPCDGKVLNFGVVDESSGQIEQVKGISYSLKTFLGPHSWPQYQKLGPVSNEQSVKEIQRKQTELASHVKRLEKSAENITGREYVRDIVTGGNKKLYQIVIYLAPGDYHRFHSPADVIIHHRRHFPGGLLSVNPGVAKRIPGLFNINERAVYYGQWKHGFFAMSPVGATNVGSISTYFDRELVTNQPGKNPERFTDKVFPTGLPLRKADPFGEFNLGSTIVMIFEAPSDFRWSGSLKIGGRVRVGEGLGEPKSHEESEQHAAAAESH